MTVSKLVFASLLAGCATTAAPRDRVLAALRTDHIDEACVAFADEDGGVIAVHENHVGQCPGDPQTSPVFRRYRVVAAKLELYDPATDTWH